jgi:hypothetical protein|tara:strand:+ start:376 stop:618 length:243 start_codon:yes stop_codon:yes gene_type:complete
VTFFLKQALTRYPKLKLFAGFGTVAQSLEGTILRKALVLGLNAGKVMLPIHDAVAVQVDNASWAADVLEELWIDHINIYA